MLTQSPLTPTRILHWLKNPVLAARRVAYRVYELRHPDEPWIAQGAVRYCDEVLRPPMRGFETGSGRSTAWFAARLGHLTSVEHHPEWYARIRPKLAHLPHVDYRLVPLDHPPQEPTRAEYDPLPRYVAALAEQPDASLDFVVVDGHYRQACVRAALTKLRPGGLLLIDNSNWMSDREWGVPSDWPLVHRSENVMTQTSIWRKPGA